MILLAEIYCCVSLYIKYIFFGYGMSAKTFQQPGRCIFYALSHFSYHWRPAKIQLHHDIRDLGQQIVVLHCSAVSAVDMADSILAVLLIVEPLIFDLPSPSPRFDQFLQVPYCYFYICDPLEFYLLPLPFLLRLIFILI